jgi:hypothetical protein
MVPEILRVIKGPAEIAEIAEIFSACTAEVGSHRYHGNRRNIISLCG